MPAPVTKRSVHFAVGTIADFTPTNTGCVGLLNNSTGPYVIVVWDLAISFNVNRVNASAGYFFQRGGLTTAAGAGVSIVTGQPTPGGLLSYDDLATPTPIIANYVSSYAPAFNVMSFPLGILQPGNAMVFTAATPAALFGATFYYEILNADALAETPIETQFD